MTKLSPPIPADRTIQFGIVGCGFMANKHFAAINTHAGRANISAVCDLNEANLQQAVQQTGAAGFSSLQALLEDSTADAIVLTTPSGLHPEQGMQAAAAGRHVITEKPVATHWEKGKRFVTACEQAGVRLFVVHQNRYIPSLQRLKQAIDQGRFGKIYMVQANVFWTRPQEFYSEAGWRGTWDMDGGALMNQGSHYVDLLCWLIGPVESVHAFTDTLGRNIEAEDTGVVSLKWRSGAMGSLNLTVLTYPRNLETMITILGENGTVKIGGQNRFDILNWEFADADPKDSETGAGERTVTSPPGDPLSIYYDNVINVIHGTADPEVDGRAGLQSLEVLAAAYLSAGEARRVALPLP